MKDGEKILEINFELEKNFHREIKKYAIFLSISEKSLMAILLAKGIEEYKENKEEIRMRPLVHIREVREKMNCAYRKLKRIEAGIDSDLDEDTIDEEYRDARDALNKLVTKCKIEIPDEMVQELKSIKKEANKTGNIKYIQSDIVHALIYHAKCRELDFLKDQYAWKADLLGDAEYNRPKEVRTEIPAVIYKNLEVRADSFKIKVNEYLKLILCDWFNENTKDKMQGV